MKTERLDPLEKVLSLTTRLRQFLSSNSLKRTITIYRSCVTCTKQKGSFGCTKNVRLNYRPPRDRATINIRGSRHHWILAYCLQKDTRHAHWSYAFLFLLSVLYADLWPCVDPLTNSGRVEASVWWSERAKVGCPIK